MLHSLIVYREACWKCGWRMVCSYWKIWLKYIRVQAIGLSSAKFQQSSLGISKHNTPFAKVVRLQAILHLRRWSTSRSDSIWGVCVSTLPSRGNVFEARKVYTFTIPNACRMANLVEASQLSYAYPSWSLGSFMELEPKVRG